MDFNEIRREADLVRAEFMHDPFVSDEDFGRLVEEADQRDQQREWGEGGA